MLFFFFFLLRCVLLLVVSALVHSHILKTSKCLCDQPALGWKTSDDPEYWNPSTSVESLLPFASSTRTEPLPSLLTQYSSHYCINHTNQHNSLWLEYRSHTVVSTLTPSDIEERSDTKALLTFGTGSSALRTSNDMASKWADSDEIALRLAQAAQDPNLEHRQSITLELDKSQPPTPDGTGRPANFDIVAPGLYRSSYPSFPHFETLADLELKTIVTFVPEPLPLAYANFITSNGIAHHHVHVLANKDESICTDDETVHKILDLMLDPENYPMLIHCNKGKHRTGCMVACFRRVTGWSVEAAIEEYVRYASPKERELDKKFIERFDPSVLKPLALERRLYGQMMQQRGAGGASTQSSLYTACTNETNYDDVLSDVGKRISLEEELKASAKLWNYK